MFCLHFAAKDCLALAHKLEIVNDGNFSLILTSLPTCVSACREKRRKKPRGYSPRDVSEERTEYGPPGEMFNA